MIKNKIIIIHPGVHHAYRLANALVVSGLFNQVRLCTWFLIKTNSSFANISLFKKRVKEIDQQVILHVFPLFELFKILNEKLFFLFFPKKVNINYNNIQYLWSQIFGLYLIPYLYFHRINCVIVLYDTCGWPLSYFAKKWHIPIIMDFPSISHESAVVLGIEETNYGINLKEKERQHIDFALYCSNFAKQTYHQKTSAKLNFTAYVGAALPDIEVAPINYDVSVLQMAFIANMELRKGLDFLLNAVTNLKIPFQLHLIGKISKNWVIERIDPILIKEGKIIFTGAFNQKELIDYLHEQNIQIHILPSRFDSFGMVISETMMLGIPNIVSPFVGAGEKIRPGVDGFIMEELSSKELEKLILRFYHLPTSDKVKISNQAYQQSKLISWNNYNEQIGLIFSKILSHIRPKIGFVVSHPTQFEVPFYKYVQLNERDIDFEVIYIHTNQELHLDKEINRKIDWGFNLYEDYTYHIIKSRKELKKLFKNNKYNLLITNGYNGKYLKLLDLLIFQDGKLALRIDSIISNQPFGWRFWKVPILKILFKIFDHFLVVGTLTKNYVLGLIESENKINIFSYSIDYKRFSIPEKKPFLLLQKELNLGKRKVFLCVAKLVDRESPLDPINAFINSKQTDWTLLIVGDGRNKKELENYCLKYPAADIRFIGYVNYVHLPLYYHLADVFIHATKQENWGVSVHEAIASSCTVIASDNVGSACDLIIEGANGYTYPFKNVELLQLRMHSALKLNPQLKYETNRYILQKWGYDKMWQEIKSILYTNK